MAKRNRVRSLKPAQAEWTPFVKGVPSDDTKDPTVDAQQAWVNSRYQVLVFRYTDMPLFVHLSIKRQDRGSLHDWRDLQRIKNELAGTSCEAAELYPSEDRLKDAANQYHLWVLEPGRRFPFGYHDGRVVSADPGVREALDKAWDDRTIQLGAAKPRQREFEAHQYYTGCPRVGPIWENPTTPITIPHQQPFGKVE